MNFEWIKCEDKLPEMPTSPFGQRQYLVAWKSADKYSYSTISWAAGWNCSLNWDGKIIRKHEIKDIVAWAEIPEYED